MIRFLAGSAKHKPNIYSAVVIIKKIINKKVLILWGGAKQLKCNFLNSLKLSSFLSVGPFKSLIASHYTARCAFFLF